MVSFFDIAYNGVNLLKLRDFNAFIAAAGHN